MAEVTLNKAKYSSRLYASALDFFIMTLLALLGVILTQKIFMNVPYYKQAGETINEIERKSHLYAMNKDGSLVILSKFLTVTDESQLPEINTRLDNSLKEFYKDPMFFDQSDPNSGITLYNIERIKSELFIYTTDEHTDVAPKQGVGQPALYSFYCGAMEKTAMSYLIQYPGYVEASKTLNLTFIFCILLIPIVLSATICEYIVPLCLKRGRKTFGKWLLRIGVTDSRGLSPKLGRFTCRFLFFLFIEVLLGIISFGIPIIISFSMFVFSKKSQSLHDYVTNTYVVDTSDNRIFMNEKEYFEKMEEASKMELHKKQIRY